MARTFMLPDIGEGLAEAEIVRWLVPVGEQVAVDQPVVELETDKAVVEIPSPYSGVVLHHGGAEGDVIEVGSVLLVVGEPGETWPPEDAAPAAPAEAAPIVGTLSDQAEHLTGGSEPHPQMFSRRVQALPVVRKLAKDLGVDLTTIEGSGPEGRITREDVIAAQERRDGEDRPAAAPAAQPPKPGDRRRMSKLRRTIAANMTTAWTQIPHVTTFDEVDATRLLAARKALVERHGAAVSIDALVVKAVLPALERFPEFTAAIEGDELVFPGRLDIGVAVDTDEGLMVAVVTDPSSMTLLDLSAEIARLSEGAKARSLSTEELTGQCFTVSNIGALGGGFGTPLIPPGTMAILSVGRATDQPVAVDGRIDVAPVMPLSLSYDHRVIDGGLGRRFMAMVLENLAEPALFLA